MTQNNKKIQLSKYRKEEFLELSKVAMKKGLYTALETTPVDMKWFYAENYWGHGFMADVLERYLQELIDNTDEKFVDDFIDTIYEEVLSQLVEENNND